MNTLPPRPFVASVTLVVAALALVVVVVVRPSAELEPAGESGLEGVDFGSEVDPRSVYDPYRAGESLPAGYFQVLPRDLIRPVYQPRFVAAEASGWPDEADVIGVEIGGQARAYPVSLLTGRELVVDAIGGEPLLVSW